MRSDIRKPFLAVGAAKPWDKLPRESPVLGIFKSRLDTHLSGMG